MPVLATFAFALFLPQRFCLPCDIVCSTRTRCTNATHYPVLLSSPVRGAEYESIGQSKTIYPVVDRTIRQTGIRLPFANNKLAFMPNEGVEQLS